MSTVPKITSGCSRMSSDSKTKKQRITHGLPESPRFQGCWEEQFPEGDPQACADALWRTSIGLDLADRSVLEGEVLIWRIAQQMEFQPHRPA